MRWEYIGRKERLRYRQLIGLMMKGSVTLVPSNHQQGKLRIQHF